MPPASPVVPTVEEIAIAVQVLRRGGLVAMPTETVYGLAADARDVEAVRRIFAAKGRPADHPLIVHLHDASALDLWAREIPASARVLAEAFWPGPLTLVLRKSAVVDPAITGGQDTVGLRVPAHPVARALLVAFGGALAAPSANRFGRISPTTAAHVREEFPGGEVWVLDGGPSEVGLESTIIDLSGPRPRLLRPGAVAASAIEARIGPLERPDDRAGPRASGRLVAHYAPGKPLELVDQASVAEHLHLHPAGTHWIAPGPLPANCAGEALPADAEGYAKTLYAALRRADAGDGLRIAAIRPPDDEAWAAVQDRLVRAAAGSGGDHAP
ncbi:MAG: threonylcarbamoyl-AMP synthase [Xanthomonadales bacterium]|nr:Threonylcarbamoyl-AMP synthase [Xanthomonadales bacterium]MCC6592783.1 threonylcarbamoyl-AMP synthase [Xanthomonadales bacterium]MCE7932615.1 threonylcarbamoyl-AMP synthase [Xanthomonadales bacterium PRO6]